MLSYAHLLPPTATDCRRLPLAATDCFFFVDTDRLELALGGSRRVVKEWGRNHSKEGATEKDLITSGLKNLPLSLNDTSDEGKAASQVLQKMLSQSLTTFKVEDAIARAKTPRDADTVNAAKKQKSSADAPAG